MTQFRSLFLLCLSLPVLNAYSPACNATLNNAISGKPCEHLVQQLLQKNTTTFGCYSSIGLCPKAPVEFATSNTVGDALGASDCPLCSDSACTSTLQAAVDATLRANQTCTLPEEQQLAVMRDQTLLTCNVAAIQIPAPGHTLMPTTPCLACSVKLCSSGERPNAVCSGRSCKALPQECIVRAMSSQKYVRQVRA